MIHFLRTLFWLSTTAFVLMIGCSDSDNPTTPPPSTDDDKTAPTVSIISPKQDESVGRQLLTVDIQASDNKGVTKVEVFLNNIVNPVASLVAAPWKAVISIAGLQDGSHTVYAKAYDAAGNVTTSAVVTFKRGALIDITEPTVAIKSPAVNEVFGLHEMGVEADADDNVGVVKVEFFIDGSSTPSAMSLSRPYQAVITIADLSEGSHTIMAKAYDASGNIGSSQSIAFRKENIRITLVEIITSANCPPCAPANAYYKDNIKGSQKAKVATIKNHVWWPASTDRLWHESQTWSKPRTDYLFYPEPTYYAPAAWVNGKIMGSVASDWIVQVTNDKNLPPEAKIELTVNVVGTSATIDAKVTGIASAPYSDLKLHTAILEDDINYSDGNGETTHYDVMRMMLPDANGESFTLSNGETKTFTRNVSFDTRWNKDKLKVVVFVQSNGSKKILQAARLPLR